MDGTWIRRPKAGNVAVFVHGILSSPKKCWTHPSGSYWPNIFSATTDLGDFGVYVFTYQTDVLSGTYRLGNVVDALKEHLRLDGLMNCQRLLFVCHSMGGIVVRKFVVEREADLQTAGISLGLFLLGSPSLGSRYANWFRPVAEFMGHAQIQALRFSQNNDWLLDLDKEFNNLKEARRLSMIGKELVEDKFVALRGLFRRQVVEPFSAARYFGEPYKVPGSDHFSIAAPKDAGEIQHRMLVDFADSVRKLSATVQKSTRTAITLKLLIDAWDGIRAPHPMPTSLNDDMAHKALNAIKLISSYWRSADITEKELLRTECCAPYSQWFGALDGRNYAFSDGKTAHQHFEGELRQTYVEMNGK